MRARARDALGSALTNQGCKEEALTAAAAALTDARAAGRARLIALIQARMQAIRQGHRPRAPVTQRQGQP